MTAKMDLLAKLTALMPECAGEIAKILHDYEIMPAKVYERSNLPRRVDAFLAAKRIDGCRPKFLLAPLREGRHEIRHDPRTDWLISTRAPTRGATAIFHKTTS